MKIYTSYKTRIREYRHIFGDTVRLYRQAVDFLINVCLQSWTELATIQSALQRKSFIERMTHKTADRPDVPYDFDGRFYKFPSYLRRAAIAEAVGAVSSYMTRMQQWEEADHASRGLQPSVPKAGMTYPVMYRGDCSKQTGENSFQIKIFRDNTWNWLEVAVRKSDMEYIRRHCMERHMGSPTLRKRHKCWYLEFSFEETVVLNDTPVMDQRILAVDLGINTPATCSVLTADGAVAGRHFLKLPAEYDCLQRKLNRIVRAQKHGSRSLKNLWAIANGINQQIAVKTAQFIADIAALYNVDVVVFEHLDVSGRKHGSKKQRLQLWRAKAVQSIAADKLHRLGIRISRVNAWGTSRLAFDGSGNVKRGRESERIEKNYSICEFTTGKIYNCDLNASYNIGARYFIREILKSLPVTARQRMEAKVPACAKRSTCTLSTLISLNAELHAAA